MKQAIIRVINQIIRFSRLDKIHLEDTAFDTRALTDGYKPYRWQYQKSNRLDENIRKAVILRDNCKCQMCGKGNRVLEVHHITPRRWGGSDTLSNLISLCSDCHAKVTGNEQYYFDIFYKKINGRNITGLKYAQHVMQGKIWLRSQLVKLGTLMLTNGGETANRRLDWNISKSHSNDAVCITGLKSDILDLQEWLIKPMRKKNKAKTDEVLGFRHRDIVRYTDKKGVTYQGYVIALFPYRNLLSFQSPKKMISRIRAKSCEMVWRFNKIYWLNNVICA